MGNRHKLIMKRPASWFGSLWKEAIPLGNGKLGALVYGGVQKEICILNRYDLWHWGEDHPLPDVHETLKESRDAIDRGDYAYANQLLTETLKKQNYDSSLSTPFPLGALTISVGEEDSFRDYQRILDMEQGEAVISYQKGNAKVERRCLVSRKRDLLAYEISSDRKIGVIRAAIGLSDTGDVELKKMERELDGRIRIWTEEEYLFFQISGKDGYGAVLRVICRNGKICGCGSEIKAEDTDQVLFLVKTYASDAGEQEIRRLKRELETVEADYKRLLSEHKETYSPLYRSSDLILGLEKDPERSNEELLLNAYEKEASLELLEKLWHFGRYLFICGTCEEGLPFPLYGLWNGEYEPVWAQNVANENIQMMYWHTQTGGLTKLMKPVIDYYYEKIPRMKENAEKLFGCRGIFLSTYTTPINTYVNPVVPVITNWIGGAGWIAQHFYLYYVYTGDEMLLKEKILPFLMEAAQFYEDYAVYDENGRMKLYPSVSPENSPANFVNDDQLVHLAHPMPAVCNATMDFAIIKELLGNLLELCEKRDLYPEKQKVWKKMREAIPDYMVNEDGAIKEWMHPELKDHYCHRHLSHLYPVFPGKEIYRESPLYHAFEKAVDLRKLGGQVGWSLVHMAAIYARFLRGEDSIRCLDLLVKGVVLNNFFMLSNDYRDMGVTMDVGQFAPIQLDANLGLVNALQEMLFYARERYMKILPACPERLSEGKASGFCFPGGKISFEWNLSKAAFHAEILLERKGELEIELPDFAGKMKSWSTEGIVLRKKKNKLLLRCEKPGEVRLG